MFLINETSINLDYTTSIGKTISELYRKRSWHISMCYGGILCRFPGREIN
jgi:hypothetical protein